MLMDVSFSCECGETIETTVYVPEPNFMAEKNKDSGSDHWEEIYCDSCEKEHEVYVTNTFYAANCSIDNGDTEVSYGMPYYQDEEQEELSWVIESKSQIDTFHSQIQSVEKLLNADVDQDTKFSLLVMLHGHVVAAVEAYLASTFIHKVTNSEELTKKLVETDPTFSKRTFTLKEIFEKQENLKLTVATYLKDLIFHDLKKVKPMYKDVFGHDFGDISWLFQAILIRHHCVHRAGLDKEGNKVEISDTSVLDLVSKSIELINAVEEKANKIDESSDWPF